MIVLVTHDFNLLDPKLAADTSRQLWHDGTSVSPFVDVQNPGITIAKKMVHGMQTVTLCASEFWTMVHHILRTRLVVRSFKLRKAIT